jgi:hypothetical protein
VRGQAFPEAVLLVDRPAIARFFRASRLAVVCIDGSPRALVARLQRGFRAGERAVVLYVHDAATVVYPFALEPVATALAHGPPGSLVFADLGLPPLGATARRFGDARFSTTKLIFTLDAIPPATLVKYCEDEAQRLDARTTRTTSATRTTKSDGPRRARSR